MQQDLTISTEDGLALSATLYHPETPAKAGVIINSATAVKQGYYQNFALYLAERGYLVITYDYRGIGKSAVKNFRDPKLTMQAWGEKDFNAVIAKVTQTFNEIDWHCIGHSVGGQIIGLAEHNHLLKSVYCVSSQSGYWRYWRAQHKAKIYVMWHLIVPTVARLLGRVPGVFLGGEALPGGIARQWAFWGRSKGYIVDAQRSPIREGFQRLTCKMKFLHINDDHFYAPIHAVKALESYYANAISDVEVIDAQKQHSGKVGHFGFFRRQHQQGLWPHALAWLESEQ